MATIKSEIENAAHKMKEAGLYFGHGVQNEKDEAAWLVLHALNLPLDTDFLTPPFDTQEINQTEGEKINTLLNERINTKKPLAYLTNQAWLQGLSFYIDERAIIPRSLIAEIIADENIDSFLNPDTKNILDLCTGQASLAILSALTWNETKIDAVDISDDALEVAKINIKKYELENQIQLIKNNGLNNLSQKNNNKKYDLIICNPPYVNANSMEKLPQEYKHEPNLALAGGENGMDFIKELIKQIPQYITKSGVLLLEIGNEIKNFQSEFPELAPRTIWLETSAGDEQVLMIKY